MALARLTVVSGYSNSCAKISRAGRFIRILTGIDNNRLVGVTEEVADDMLFPQILVA